MKAKDPLKQFLDLREALRAEREQLTARLRDINATLFPSPTNGSNSGLVSTHRPVKRGPLSLKEAILKATAKKALAKEEILQAVLDLGYVFSTNDPLNSIGVIIYGKNPKFTNEGGRFRSS